MKKRSIKKVAIIGSGIMGSGIACHFANIGVQVLLLDIVPRELTEIEKKKGQSLEDKVVRDRIVNEHLKNALKSNPSPIYHKSFAERIETGNTEDDMHKIAEVDWIIEVVTEQLKIKNIVFEQIEKYRKKGTIVTSNTSGIPIHLMSQGRSEDFQEHFAVTHFFNPPRYLRLFEVVPSPKCKPEIVDFLMHYGDKFLGKTSVLAKDTPAFIGNRIGVFGIMSILKTVKDLDMTIEEVDKLTGPLIGRPKSATFRTVDVVGLDTLVHTIKGIADNVKEDEMADLFEVPEFIHKMVEKNLLGSKTKQGFYKKVTNEAGKKEILSLDLNTLEYRPKKSAKFATLELTKNIDDVLERFPILVKGKDKAGEFFRKTLAMLFAYVSNRIPEISDELYRIDDAVKAGFGWENGPFELWDAVGVEKSLAWMKEEGFTPNNWVNDMLASGVSSFYSVENGEKKYYDIKSKSYQKIANQEGFLILNNIRETKTIWENKEAQIQHLGDGVLNLEFRSKMNTLGAGVLQGINKAIDLAETEYEAVILGNQAQHFSVGANLAMAFMMAIEQEYDELDYSIRFFQNTVMRLRYSSIPTIVAPHGMTLGGGCELTLHADKVVAAAETYIGLVEFGVGLIPAGGGTKEMVRRTSELFQKDDVQLNRLRESFINIAMAKVATSAYEAQDFNYIQKNKDIIVVNKDRQLATAKRYALQMLEDGYTQPVPEKVEVLGQQALGMFLVGTDSLQKGNFASEHDKLIANKLAYVMSGGDLSEKSKVSEQYLLNLEREAFLSLLTERKTLERIQHTLKTGKPLRN
ncbi:3-hydroxyacyl-CoA dehydrogenase/enoyl-CoA hydratase family protein [Aureivirga sp. CE67]|uniref:3-hydroxyacyl-CoA dehydrogenase/enoyl-CoA hydratase family protein n=1 Tax=Aureivirga sp. CE67 TaxID=1788983 RepID=UPI0018C97009|nr:3-hydroxyacyl-CoA dehydrogenase/enoyl-CoA hydratase family protein [Aureivirga sp. CE67]